MGLNEYRRKTPSVIAVEWNKGDPIPEGCERDAVGVWLLLNDDNRHLLKPGEWIVYEGDRISLYPARTFHDFFEKKAY